MRLICDEKSIHVKKDNEKKKRNLLGCNWAMAAMRLRSTTGGSSAFCSQPTGGLAGGEIRKSLSGSGGRKYPSGFAPRKTIG